MKVLKIALLIFFARFSSYAQASQYEVQACKSEVGSNVKLFYNLTEKDCFGHGDKNYYIVGGNAYCVQALLNTLIQTTSLNDYDGPLATGLRNYRDTFRPELVLHAYRTLGVVCLTMSGDYCLNAGAHSRAEKNYSVGEFENFFNKVIAPAGFRQLSRCEKLSAAE